MMENIGRALKRLKQHPGVVKDQDLFWEKLQNSFRSIRGHTDDKLAAVERWRKDGLLQHATEAFEQGVQDLLFETSVQVNPGTTPSTPGHCESLNEGQQQHTAAAQERQAAETSPDNQQQTPAPPTGSNPPSGTPGLHSEARVDAPQSGSVPAAETLQLDDIEMQPADTDETGTPDSVDVETMKVEQLFTAAKQYQLEHVPTPAEIRDLTSLGMKAVQSIPFQQEGVARMLHRESTPEVLLRGPNGNLLFDSPGLGKTIQAIGLVRANPRSPGAAGTLIFVPDVIIEQWQEELHVHSNLSVLHYTGVANHSLRKSKAARLSSDATGPLEHLTHGALMEKHGAAQQAARVDAQARGQDPDAAAAAVQAPTLGSLQDQFIPALLKYDVVIMSFDDAREEFRHLQPASMAHSRAHTRSSGAETGKRLFSPLMQVEFKRLIIDEVQHMGTSSSQVAQLARAVPAQHKLVMSGTPFPPGREAAALVTQLEVLLSAKGLPGRAKAAQLGDVPADVKALVERAMGAPGRGNKTSSTTAGQAQQELMQLVAPLLIRRTHDDIKGQGLTVPRQHHHVVEVKPKLCCSYIMELLKGAAKRAIKVPVGEELPARRADMLYNRLMGASSHPQFNGQLQVDADNMYAYGAFSDAALPMRHGKWTEVCPQDSMAGIIKDAVLLEILHNACHLAWTDYELATKLRGTNPSEARNVLRQALHSLEQLPIYEVDHIGSRQPLTLEQLDSSSRQLAEQAGVAAGSMYNMHKAFGGYNRPRQVYAAAVQDFTTAYTFLKSLNRDLHMPQAAAAAGGGARVKMEDPSVLEVVVPVPLVGLSLQLQDAAEEVLSAVGEFRLEAPQAFQAVDLQAADAQLQQLCGTQEQWEEIKAAAGPGLGAGEMVQWFKALKHQRDAVEKATSALEEVPEAEETGLVPAQELNRYAELLAVANKADEHYLKCWKTRHLLRGVKLPYVMGRMDMWVADQDGIFFILEGVRLQLPFDSEFNTMLDSESALVKLLKQLRAEHKAARAALAAAQTLLTAASKLAPRVSSISETMLEEQHVELQDKLDTLRVRTYPEVCDLVQQTRELAEKAAEDRLSRAELKYGSLLAGLAGLLLSDDLKDEQVVVVTANKLLYWEVIDMLWSLKICHEHLDLKTWEECGERPGGHKTRTRKRQEGLTRFKENEAQVLVLNLLDQQQAFGINLTNAHHMIVCDPVLSEPVLHQVLSRIHRYGQKHEQHVKFLVVKGSFNSLLHDRYVAASAQRFLEHGQTEIVEDGDQTAEGADAAAGPMGPAQAAAGVTHAGGAGPSAVAHDTEADRKLELLRAYFAMRR